MRVSLIAVLLAVSLPAVAVAGKRTIAAIPEPLASTAEQNAVARKFWDRSKTPLKFGAYEVTDFSRRGKIEHGNSSSLLPPYAPDPLHSDVQAEVRSWKDRFSFVLNENGTAAWEVECARNGKSEGFGRHGISIETSHDDRLVCGLAPLGSDRREQLDVSLSRTGVVSRMRASGEVSSESDLRLEGLTQLNGTKIHLPAPIGFLLLRDDAPVAAVDSSGDLVYLPKEGEDRTFYAAIASALLLSQFD